MTEPNKILPICFGCEFKERGFPCRNDDGTLCPDQLSKSLLVTYQEEIGTRRHKEHFWAYECLDKLIKEAPEIAFNLIVFALSRCRNDREIGRLVAGPLEDLIDEHGEGPIDSIEQEASNNERFRYLLSGIWGGRPHVNAEVWSRILAALREGPRLNWEPLTPQGSDKFHSEK